MNSRRAAFAVLLGVLLALLVVYAIIATIIISTRGTKLKCPFCTTSRIRPSWPRKSDKFIAWLQPYRCQACLRRFYLLKLKRITSPQRASGAA